MTDKQVIVALRTLLAYAPERIDAEWATAEIDRLARPIRHVPGQESLLCAACATPLIGLPYATIGNDAYCADCYQDRT